MPFFPRHDEQRKIRRRHRIDVRERHDPLRGHRRALDVQRAPREAERVEHAAHLVEVAAELHHDGGVGARETLAQLVLGQHAGEHGEALVPVDERHAEHRRAAEHRAHARHDFGVVARREPVMQIHVRAVEERIAFADHRDVAARVEMRGDERGRRIVEIGDHGFVAKRRRQRLGRHRVDERQVRLRIGQMPLDDAERVAFLALRDEVRHHGRGLQHAQRLERQQFGVARPDAEPEEAAGLARHSASEASALTAAAAIALPPRRPAIATNGTPRLSAARSAFDSAAPTKPTGKPRMRAGRGAPASIMSSR
ncbi:hypothetical protein DO65_4952 [Burkholderia pseudomallei]|nr:hypothetical protein DO65_4952 [Burkholderia pseudomallei]